MMSLTDCLTIRIKSHVSEFNIATHCWLTFNNFNLIYFRIDDVDLWLLLFNTNWWMNYLFYIWIKMKYLLIFLLKFAGFAYGLFEFRFNFMVIWHIPDTTIDGLHLQCRTSNVDVISTIEYYFPSTVRKYSL